MTTKNEFKCILCKESFDDKETLQIHFRKHGDPNFNQNEKKSWCNLASQSSEERSKGVTEMVGCDVCSEMFPTISKAITHKHKIHPDHNGKHFCPWCGKLFTLKHLYNNHIQASHANVEENEEKPFHCDPCEVDFYVSTAMFYHNKFFHRQDTDIPAFGHSKKLKMHNQEVLQVYYCSFCGEEYVNKVNLHKHTIDDHADENQSPNDILRCPLCDAIFYHLDAYEVHLTFHSVEDIYSEKNELMDNITDFSLEAVPPSEEKVENCEPQRDAETTMTEMSVEDILQMAADQSEEQNSKKSKKHKKHKKSKKSAITLDEFLNMNADVFGEGLDFQGVEEVPTRVITKRLKLHKKNQNSRLETTPELEKLRKQGIIIKKKSDETKKLLINTPNSLLDEKKTNPKEESNSSNEVLSKLLSQSNNQIQIIKKGAQDNSSQLSKINYIEKDVEKPAITMENENMECDSTKEEICEPTNQSRWSKIAMESKQRSQNTKLDNLDYSEKKFSQDSQDSNSKSECLSPNQSMENLNDFIDDHELDTNENDVNKEKNDTIAGTKASRDVIYSEKVPDSTIPLTNRIKSTVDSISTKAENNSNICRNLSDNSIDADESNGKIDQNIKSDKGIIHETSAPLSALKHLSHLITVKPVYQTKPAVEERKKTTDDENALSENMEVCDKISSDNTVTSSDCLKDMNHVSPIRESALGTLRNLSKNITFKSLSRNNDDIKSKIANPDDFDIDDKFEQKPIETSNSQHAIEDILSTSAESTNINNKKLAIIDAVKWSPRTDCQENLEFKSETICDDKNTNKTNSDILKHLTNITAKPLHITKSTNSVTLSKSSSPSRHIYKSCIQTIQKAENNQGIVEILNIDDSDSDDIDNINQEIYYKTLTPLTSLSKNSTVKTSTQRISQSNINSINNNQEKEMSHDKTVINNFVEKRSSVSNVENSTFISPKSTNERNTAIKQVLKTLGKHITVKSNNSSPSNPTKYQKLNSDNDISHVNSDKGSSSSKVNITEMYEDYDSDEEMKSIQTNKNVVIQTPDGSCSENENANEDFDYQGSDLELEIKVNTVKKSDENLQSFNTSSLNSLKNISKDITIKSLNNINNPETATCEQNLGNSQNVNSNIKEFKKAIRPNQKIQPEILSNNKKQVPVKKIDHTFANQQMATSSNQVNTVNKEVSVKTFQTQTKTVIEEITTTVTKTIKTVNQTMEEKVQNAFQSTSMPMVPQRIQGIRVNQQPKNIQGINIRHAKSPGTGPKIRNPTPIRPVIGSMVRPSNQLVPVSSALLPKQAQRQGTNVVRLNTPRMSSQQIIRPTMVNQQNPKVRSCLKVSPNAIVSSASKRTNSEEPVGHFSCFKKSKESLIPVSEFPVFHNNDEAKFEHSATMQMSKSNFTSKTVKDNSVVTTSQVKTEMSAMSLQHLSKLSSVSGLRVVKTSQSKQVQESSENCTMKRNTLDAIEKLQKQGLLIKRPRVDHSEESEHSEPGGDDNINYSSMDENDM